MKRGKLSAQRLAISPLLTNINMDDGNTGPIMSNSLIANVSPHVGGCLLAFHQAGYSRDCVHSPTVAAQPRRNTSLVSRDPSGRAVIDLQGFGAALFLMVLTA